MLSLIIENNLFSWPNGHSNKLFSNNQLQLVVYPLRKFIEQKLKGMSLKGHTSLPFECSLFEEFPTSWNQRQFTGDMAVQ